MTSTRFEQKVDALRAYCGQQRCLGWQRFFLLVGLLSWTLWVFRWNFEPDIDVFTRIAIGSYIHQHGEVPMQDPYTFTETKPIWHDHELIPAVLFYAVDAVGGLGALFFAKLIFCLGTLLIIDRAQSRVQSQGIFSFFLLFLCIFGSLTVWYPNIRAHVFTFFLYSYLLYAFVTYSKIGSRIPLLMVPIAMLIWVNSHGGFVVGMAALTTYSVSLLLTNRRAAITPLLVLCLSIAILFLQPYGPSFLWFIYEAVTNTPRYIATDPPMHIAEWLPPAFGSLGQIVPAFLLLCIGYGAYVLRAALPVEGVLLLAMTAWGGFNHVRFLPFLFLTIAVYGLPPLSAVYAHVRGFCPGRAVTLERALLICMSIMMLVGVGLTVYVGAALLKGLPTVKTSWPSQDSIDWLLAHRTGGTILTSYNDGSYALYRVYPRFKISLDGRFDGVFPLSTLDIVSAACDCQNKRHQQTLAQINPDFVLTTAAKYQEGIQSSGTNCFPGYQEVFAGKEYVILERPVQKQEP